MSNMSELRFDEDLYFRHRGCSEFTLCKLSGINDSGLYIVKSKTPHRSSRYPRLETKVLRRNEIYTVKDIVNIGESMWLI